MADAPVVFTDVFPTPWGWAGAAWSQRGVRRIVLPAAGREEAERTLAETFGQGLPRRPWPELRKQVREYLAGGRTAFSLPLDLDAPGAFTARVWALVRRIPYGERVTYGEIARRAGSPGGARAAGQALGRNPVPLLIPCHRVVAAGGPGGFTGGGGRAAKERLLRLEAGGGRAAGGKRSGRRA